MADSKGRRGTVSPLLPRHVSARLALGFFDNALRAGDKAFVVRHLLRGCARCSERVLRIGTEEGFLAAPRRDAERCVAMESPEVGTRRLLGTAQWAILRSAADRMAFLEAHPEFHHLGLYERLIEVSKDEARRDPAMAAGIADLAAVVARRLRVPAVLRHDYLATACAVRGNALRVGADFAGAEASLHAAWEHREDGTSDPLVAGLLHRYEGALYGDLGRYREAESAFHGALAEYASAGDEHLQGRTLLSMAAYALHYDPTAARALLGRANLLYDPALEPFLEWCARHMEVWALNELGKPMEALHLLESSRELYHRFGYSDLWVRLRMYWVEARIAFSLGQVRAAEEILFMLFKLLDEEGKHPVDLTLVAVDLLHVISTQPRRHEDILAFSETLLPLLRHLGLHDQGRAILLLLRDRLRQGVLDAVRWKAIETYFRGNWHRPQAETPCLP